LSTNHPSSDLLPTFSPSELPTVDHVESLSLQSATTNDFQQSTAFAVVISVAITLLFSLLICGYMRLQLMQKSRIEIDSNSSEANAAGEVGITYTHIDNAAIDTRNICRVVINPTIDAMGSETAGTENRRNRCELVVNPTIDDVNADDSLHVNHFDVFPDDDDFLFKQFYKGKFRPAAPVSLSPSFDSNADDFEISQVYSSNDSIRLNSINSSSSSNFK
jgi:hypothetical protein